MHALDHMCLFSLVAKQSPGALILVDNGQLTARLVKQYLMYHPVSPSGVNDSTVEHSEPRNDHDRQHDRVGPIEGILLDQDGKDEQGHQEPHVQQWNRVPLKTMILVSF